MQRSRKLPPDPILKAIADEAILSAILNLPREYLIAHPDVKIKPSDKKKIESYQQRLLDGEPLAYILGEKWFYGSRFMVSPDVLIPRAETELLIDCALAAIKKHQPAMIFDIGTGSGVIAVTIARLAKLPVFAIDISKKALEMAQKNATAILEKKDSLVRFAESDLLAVIPSLPEHTLICANLPYLSGRELREPTIAHEPRLALAGAYGKNASSAAVIYMLIDQIAAKRKGPVTIILEINSNQASPIKKKARQLFPNAEITVHQDHSKFDRIVVISVP
jgi:release factor glutamine methyltransferase